MMIDYKEILQKFPDKLEAIEMAKEAANDKDKLKSLWLLAKSKDKAAWRAAWIMDKVNDISPDGITPYIEEMIELSTKTNCQSKIRQFLKLISLHSLTKSVDGIFIGKCFDWLNDRKMPTAIRVYSMQVLYNFSQHEPDIKNELGECIEFHFDESSAGFRARGKRILRQLKR